MKWFTQTDNPSMEAALDDARSLLDDAARRQDRPQIRAVVQWFASTPGLSVGVHRRWIPALQRAGLVLDATTDRTDRLLIERTLGRSFLAVHDYRSAFQAYRAAIRTGQKQLVRERAKSPDSYVADVLAADQLGVHRALKGMSGRRTADLRYIEVAIPGLLELQPLSPIGVRDAIEGIEVGAYVLTQEHGLLAGRPWRQVHLAAKSLRHAVAYEGADLTGDYADILRNAVDSALPPVRETRVVGEFGF